MTKKSTKEKVQKKVNNKIISIKKKLNAQDNVDKKIRKQKRHIFLITMLIILIAIFLMGLAFIIYIIVSAPDFNTEELYSQSSTTLLDKNGNEYARLGAQNRELVKYDDLPQVLVDAIVATEDSRFFQHDGFDIARFLKASLSQLSGNDGGGASTLTMQVAKNTYTDAKLTSGLKGIIRKFTDIYMSIFKIEKNYTKEEIIEFYVNSNYMGASSWGVEQACQTYFGKSVRDISLPEAALIAGIFNAPTSLNPFASVDNATDRRDTVLYLMYRHGYITEEQYNDAKDISVDSLIIEQTSKGLNKYQSFIDTVIDEVQKNTELNPVKVSMTIKTTMDPTVQDALIEMNNGAYYKWKNDYEQAAVAVTDMHDGSITAISGRRNQSGERQKNLATTYHTHPGSTAKPIFDYGPLIEYNNASPGTYFFDEDMTYSNGQSIKNADGKHWGMMTMRKALSESRNIPALQAFQQVDKTKIAEFVHSLGINYGDTLYESYSIGSFDGVTALELSAAYAAFGRGGYYIKPYSYTELTLNNSNETIENKPKKEKVMSEATAYLITSILVSAGNNGVGGNFKINGTEIAAKTGTSTWDGNALKAAGIKTEASRDNWNCTYSPDYSISLWYGYEQLMKDYYTQSISAAGVRKRLMAGIAKKIYKTNSKFEVPSSVTKVEIEKDTVPLQLPSEYTPQDMRTTELFKTGTEPTEVSNRYQGLDNPTNGKATTSGNQITLSWDGITTPNAINPEYLQNYFNDNYGQFANNYYNKRISANNTSLGTLTYDIYLETDGTQKYIASTSNTSYTYQGNPGTSYKFVIKSAYTIFKSNASSGLVINANTGGNATDNINLKLTKNDECIIKSNNTAEYYNDSFPVSATDINGNDITDKLTNKKTIITNLDNNSEVKSINKSVQGKYKITYKATYNGTEVTISRTITIADVCD